MASNYFLARRAWLAVALAGLIVASVAAIAQTTSQAPVADPLFERISALDTAMFDAFNQCEKPGELDKHAAFFANDVEFYHDNGGVTWTRDAMIANTGKFVCGHFRRQLVPGSLQVYPIKDFGAIEIGTHRFCRNDTGKCDGMADFTMVWREQDGLWQITRALSYGHREIK